MPFRKAPIIRVDGPQFDLQQAQTNTAPAMDEDDKRRQRISSSSSSGSGSSNLWSTAARRLSRALTISATTGHASQAQSLAILLHKAKKQKKLSQVEVFETLGLKEGPELAAQLDLSDVLVEASPLVEEAEEEQLVEDSLDEDNVASTETEQEKSSELSPIASSAEEEEANLAAAACEPTKQAPPGLCTPPSTTAAFLNRRQPPAERRATMEPTTGGVTRRRRSAVGTKRSLSVLAPPQSTPLRSSSFAAQTLPPDSLYALLASAARKNRSISMYHDSQADEEDTTAVPVVKVEKKLGKIAKFLARKGETDDEWDDVVKALESDALKGYLDSILEYVMYKIRETGEAFLKTVFPYSEVSLYILICLMQVISLHAILDFLPIIISFGAYTSMLYWSLKMFRNRRVFRRVAVWRHLLRVFVPEAGETRRGSAADVLATAEEPNADGESSPPVTSAADLLPPTVNVQDATVPGGDDGTRAEVDDLQRAEAMGDNEQPLSDRPFFSDELEHKLSSSSESLEHESFFSWPAMEPYVNFLTSLFVFVLFFGLCSHSMPNCLFLVALSFVLCALSWTALLDHIDSRTTALLVLALDLVSTAPRLIFSTHSTSYLSGPLLFELTNVDVGAMRVSISAASAAFIAVPVLYSLHAARHLWRAHPWTIIVRCMAAQLVVYFWWQTAIMLLASGNVSLDWANGIMTAAAIGLLLFPSNAAVACIGAAVLLQLRYALNVSSVLKAAFTLFVLFLPFTLAKVRALFERTTGTSLSFVRRKFAVLMAFYLFVVVISISLLYPGTFLVDRQPSNLTWQMFEKQCGSDSALADNIVRRQIQCSQFKGVVVSWKGAVQSVRVRKMDNRLDSLLDYLPTTAADYLRCFYGDIVDEDRTNSLLAALSVRPRPRCAIDAHNVYSFEIDASGPFGAQLISSAKGTVQLVASHRFFTVIDRLRENDVINFTAIFEQYLLKYPPRLQLIRLDCVSCRTLVEARDGEATQSVGGQNLGAASETSYSQDITYTGVWLRVYRAFRFLFNFLFAPLFVIEA